METSHRVAPALRRLLLAASFLVCALGSTGCHAFVWAGHGHGHRCGPRPHVKPPVVVISPRRPRCR